MRDKSIGLRGIALARCAFRSIWTRPWANKVLLVDDILRSGKPLRDARALLEAKGCRVVGIAVLFHQPTPRTLGFGSLQLFSLAKLETGYYADAADCELCKRGIPLERVEADQKAEEAREMVLCASSSGS
jgi:hypothetical protein